MKSEHNDGLWLQLRFLSKEEESSLKVVNPQAMEEKFESSRRKSC
jgi:hypothetical protein